MLRNPARLSEMEVVNWSSSSASEFILLRLSEDSRLVVPLFTIFLVIYLVTLLGNLSIMAVIQNDRCLHTPMYFFLSNLSFSDACYSSVTVPKLLSNIVSEKSVISFDECMAQLFFSNFLANAQCFHVVVMAFDRYTAICSPLHYMAIMNKWVCIRLVTCAWFAAVVHSLLHTLMIFRLPFCASHVVHHFSCDIPPLLELSCADTTANAVSLYVVFVFVGLTSFLIIFVSYFHIVSSILKIRSAQGRHKAFSTCTSHMTAVFLFYVTAGLRYLRLRSRYSFDIQDKIVSVIFSVATPMLNPIIYSLRNNDVKKAIWKAVRR